MKVDDQKKANNTNKKVNRGRKISDIKKSSESEQ